MKPLAVTNYTLVTALGAGRAATFGALAASRTGLAPRPFETAALDGWIGIVDALDALRLPSALASWDCRNNRLAEAGLRADDFAASVQRAADRFGAARVGVFIGTSTSGILQTEIAYRERDPSTDALPPWLVYEKSHNTASVARYVRAALGLAGPAFVVSTACSSSAKVFADAARMVETGIVDAAVVGGVDSLCMTTLYGFRSLELISPDICRPWDAARAGLSLGEGAAFALLERDADRPRAWLLGCGESSDGHHMSAPHPEGAGAALAMRAALADAGLQPADVAYLNLHGTATPGNDTAEDRAVCGIFGPGIACSSTKGFTGHTLGAAGAVEATISLLALEQGLLPASLNLRERDPALRLDPLREPRAHRARVAASNSFGFGGSNACLLLGAAR
jgi:3-oxoacyl-[acyl-carrier-protein] synthase-1